MCHFALRATLTSLWLTLAKCSLSISNCMSSCPVFLHLHNLLYHTKLDYSFRKCPIPFTIAVGNFAYGFANQAFGLTIAKFRLAILRIPFFLEDFFKSWDSDRIAWLLKYKIKFFAIFNLWIYRAKRTSWNWTFWPYTNWKSTQSWSGFFCKYDGHVLYLWWKSMRGVVVDEPHSDSQVSSGDTWEGRSDSELVAWRTETWYQGVSSGQDGYWHQSSQRQP